MYNVNIVVTWSKLDCRMKTVVEIESTRIPYPNTNWSTWR